MDTTVLLYCLRIVVLLSTYQTRFRVEARPPSLAADSKMGPRSITH